jgi:cytidylate kinase
MSAKTITFAVQIGSGGFEIARAVADQMRYRYYDWEITSQAASEAGVSPAALATAESARTGIAGFVERLLMGNTYLADDFVGPSAATLASAIQTLSSSDYRRFIERVVANLGSRGEAVIVGHAGQVVLRDVPATLRVLVCGSRAERAKRLAAGEDLSAEESNRAVQRSDQERLGFFKQTYKVDLLDPLLYDLVLNTDRLSIAAATELVMVSAHALTGYVAENEQVTRRA